MYAVNNPTLLFRQWRQIPYSELALVIYSIKSYEINRRVIIDAALSSMCRQITNSFRHFIANHFIILQFFRFLSWFYVKHFHDFLNNFTTIIVMNFTWKFTIAMIVVKVLRGKMQCIWCIEDEYAKWFVPRWHCHLIRLECSKWTYFLAFSQYHPGFSRYRWSSNGSCCGSNSMNSYRGFKF